MPTVSHFYGITVRMYFADHAPPHFHAVYGGYEAAIAIGSWAVLRGTLPNRALKLVRQWAALHHDELMANWKLVQIPETPQPIDPLP